MSVTLARLIAGGGQLTIAATGFAIGYRIGKRRGVREVLEMTDVLDEAYRNEPRREQRPPRPPKPPSVVH